MKSILVTGGAGYIGSVLTDLLLKRDYEVTVIDKLLFGGDSLLGFMNNTNFEFIHDDVINTKSLENFDCVVHLASIVGDPACAKYPELATSTNLDSTKHLYQLAHRDGVSKFVFISTCSNYGKSGKQMINEESELRPVSLYAKLKVSAEKFLLEQDKSNTCKPTCLRFATAYGMSFRPRLDLTVNEFTMELTLGNELVVFGEQFWRPYCHVTDLSAAILAVIESESEITDFNVFNVGKDTENYTKQMLVDEIVKVIPDTKIKYVKKDEDPRDYRVSFDKIHEQLGFDPKFTVPMGIKQIREAILLGLLKDKPEYRNI